MIKEYAEFERKRRNGNPDEEKRSSVRKSYAEFIRNKPRSDKTKQETLLEPSKSTSNVTSSSLPAPFKAANEMYGTVATEMNRFGKALQPMIDEAERERTTQNVTSDSEMTPERWAAMGADSSARMGLNPEATSSSPNTEINSIQIDNLSNPSSINIAFNEENEFTSPTNQYITPIENQSLGYRVVNAIEKNATRRAESREKMLEEQEKELMHIMPQPQPINELPVLLPETQKKTHENTAFATQVINESRAESWNEYEALDDTAKADLRVAADGIDAKKLTSGFTGVYVAAFGGEEYGKALQRVTDGNKARQRLIDRGYNPNQVDNWIDFTRTNVNYEYTKSLQEDFAEIGKKSPVATTLASIGLWGATLPLDVISTADDAFDGTINEPNLIDTAVQTDEMAQQGVTEGIAEHTKLGAWLYNVGMSGVKSGIASVLPGGAFVLGVDAATNAMRSYSSKGLSSNEALVGGLAAGVFEYVFERISIGNFDVLKDTNPVSLKNVTMNIAKSMGVNASEEAATELANIVYDTIINDGLSDYDILVKEYRAKGMSDEEAQAKALEDLSLRVLEAGASGLVMGAGFGTVGSTVGYVSNYAPVSNAGTQAMDSGSVDVILDAAKLAPKGTRPQQAYEHVTKKQNKGKNLTAHDIGHVAVATQDYIRENAPELNGVFKSAKTSEDVDALYNAERYRLDQMPVTPRSAIKALDADYKAAKSAVENYNTSGARAMLDGSLRNKTYSDADTVKTRKPTIGKTEAGEVVSVSSIESIEDGNITVKTSEGTTQELNIKKDIKSVDAQTLWTNAAQNFPDAESAQAFIDNYDGGSIADYTKAFKDYYHLAATGMTLSQINEHEIAPYYDLSNKAQAAAVELGQKSISYQQGVVDLTARPKTKAQQLQVNMLDSIGKHIGMNVVVVDTMSKHDGFYRPGTNQIVVALDSSSGAILRTAGHETYHFVKEEMSDRAKDIETFVLDTLKKNKGEKWVNDRLKFYEKQGYKSKEAQTDELVADSLFDAFTSKRAVKDFATENQSLAKKLVNHIQMLLSDIKNIINKLVASGKYDEIKAWQDDVASLEKLNNLFLDALDELAAKNVDAPTKTKNTAEAVKSTKHNVITKNDVNAAQSIGRKSINSLSPAELNSLSAFAKKYWNELGAKSPFFRAWFGDWREGDITPVAVADKKGKTSSTAHNADTGWEINIPGKAKNETTRHKSNKAKFALPYLDYLEDIAKNAVLLESFGSDKGGDSLLMHSFYAVADIGNGTEVLKLYVEELNNVNSDNTTKRTYMLQNITKQSGSPGSQNNSVSRVTPTAIKTVADLFTFVKQNDKNFTPNPASKIVNPDGTPKVMYHGTQSSFTAFDKKKAKSYGYYGKGFYFTDSESHAGQYGNAMAVYLDVKNPLEPGKNKLTKNQLRSFLEAVAENEDYDIWNYGTEDISEIIGSIYKDDAFAVLQDVNATAIGDLAEAISLFNSVNGTNYDGVITPTETVVYEPTQIKSATDNIGTFDKSNPDIRYSTKRDADYLTAVKNGDTEAAQRLVDEAAKAAGYTFKLFHQTENDFTVFDTNHKGAGTGDYETPFGIFMKPTDSNIGLKGQKQMPLYAKIKNPLVVHNRESLMRELKDAETVTAVQDKIKEANSDYKSRVEQAGKDLQNYLIEYRKAHPDEPRSDIYKDKGFNEIYDRENSLIEEWTAAIDELALEAKTAITEYLKNNGYDGVIIEEDVGSFGRKTKTYIALDNTQVKSSDPVTYDNNGNVIPLSERFNEKQEDIRYATKRTVASGKKKSYNKSSYYNEFDSLAMSWRYKANTKVGDVNIVSGKGSFVLLEATEDGYVELARGNWSRVKELKAEYERAHKETNESLHNYSEEYGVDRGTDTWDMFDDEDRRYGLENNTDFEKRRLQTNSSGSDEHSRSSDKGKPLIPSTKRDSSISEEASNYILDTKEYQEVMKLVDERFKLTNSVKLDEKAVDRLAGRILKKSNSNFSREQLTSRLTALFDFIANSRELSWEDVTQTAASIAKDVLTESQTLDRSMQQEYADVLNLMRESRVYISPEVRAEINHNFGSLEAFRRRLGSKLKITVTDESAVPLDVFWRELAENRPEMFEEDTNYLDMPSKLVDFFEMTSPQYINPYNIEMDMDEAAYDLALQIYDEYFNIPEVQSEAKKHAREMEALRGKYNAKIKEIHNTYRERIKHIRNEHLEKMNELRKTDRERYEKLRTEKNRKIQETKELYRQRHESYRSKRNETQLKQKLRAQIYRTAKGLTDKLVNPTDQKHVPQELIASVNEFCKAITDSGVFALDKTLKLQDAFRRISENSKDPDANLSTMYNEEIGEMLEDLRNIIGGRRLTELNSAELARVKEATQYFAHIVSMSNKAFSENIKEKLSDLQTEALDELSKLNPDRKRIKFEMQKGLLKPITFFELLESPTLMKLYQNIRDGEGRWYNIVAAAKEYRQKVAAEHGYKSWKNEKITFSPERFDGEIVLSVDEALSIYATAKREQGVEHLLLGGVVREEDAKKKLKRKDRSKSVDVRSENIPLTAKDISGISEMLTKEQKAYADSLIKYLSNDMAALGNEVSMKLFGIRKYNEKNYFPIKSASNFLYSKPAVENDARIKHMSMTKRTVPKANNPVIIGSFTETVMNHCNDMALYSAFCLSLEDFNRVYNYRTQPTTFEKPTSIKQKIDRAFGAKANGYIKQLLTDINGGVTQQAGAGFVNKMIAKAKKNAVFGSLSVAVQQPSAVARAFLYVDPKYFVASTFSKKDWNELKKYAPVAGVKEMGYFDTNVGKQAVDWMSEDGYDSLKEKAFALFKDKYYRDDKLSFLPSYMDRITWGHIWNAVKKETAHNNPDMDRNSDEFLKLAGERFTYVIDRTQVYDSVFARSEWMRSKDTGVKVATAFMSEPLTNYNMLYSAAVRVRHGDVKFGAKAVSAYLVSVAFNSVLKSIVTAARDDDDDKSYWEKYLSHLVGNFVDDPLGMIPYLKDFVSLLQGYDSSRMDTQALADIADAAMIMFDDDKSGWEKFKSSFGAVGIVAGIPIKNLIRDGEVIFRTVEKIFKGEFEPTTKKGVTYAIKSELGFDVPKKYEQLIDAYLEGDDAHYNKVNNNLKAEKSENAISEGIKKAVKNKYQAGTITEEQATDVLQELLGYDDNKAYWIIDEWGSEDEDYAKYNDFSEAVRTGNDLKDVINDYLDHGVTKKTLAGQITKTFKQEYIELYRTDNAEASALRRSLLDAYVALGYDRDDKADDIADWLE